MIRCFIIGERLLAGPLEDFERPRHSVAQAFGHPGGAPHLAMPIAGKGERGRRLAGAVASVVVVLTAACGTPAPQDYGGNWMPVNRFQDAPAEIPLVPQYVFYAAPTDETLKTMLSRWAKDSGLRLSYLPGSDFTLYKPVVRIRTTDIQAAASELSAVYSAQGICVSADSRQILVRPLGETCIDPRPDAQPAARSARAG